MHEGGVMSVDLLDLLCLLVVRAEPGSPSVRAVAWVMRLVS